MALARPRGQTGFMSLCNRALFISLSLLASSGPAPAQTRWLVVNGQRVSDIHAAQLDRLACREIPNGNYWLNPRTGVWGYAGNPRAQGVLGDACAARQRRKSLSERRELYRPGEILSH